MTKSSVHGNIGVNEAAAILNKQKDIMLASGGNPANIFLIRESSTGPALTVSILRCANNIYSVKNKRIALTSDDKWEFANDDPDVVQKKFEDGIYKAVKPESAYLRAHPEIVASFMQVITNDLKLNLDNMQWSEADNKLYDAYSCALSEPENHYSTGALTPDTFFLGRQRDHDNASRNQQEQDDREIAERIAREQDHRQDPSQH